MISLFAYLITRGIQFHTFMSLCESSTLCLLFTLLAFPTFLHRYGNNNDDFKTSTWRKPLPNVSTEVFHIPTATSVMCLWKPLMHTNQLNNHLFTIYHALRLQCTVWCLPVGHLEAHYADCYWRESCISDEFSITPSLCSPVHPVTGRCGARLSGPGPAVPVHLFYLFVLPAEQKWGAAQRWLLLHSLVCHHRNTRLQVSVNTGSEWRSPVTSVMWAALHSLTQR